MTDISSFDLLNLLPKFSLLLDGNYSSADGLAAGFVSILFIVTVLSALFCIYKFSQASCHLKFYRKLLNNVSPEELLNSRRDLVLSALETPAYGQLWKEFDESLVFNKSSNRLFNTLDAAHFFNTHNLARGLTENRLLAAVPGFLTAFGVIGTFTGLQLGLAPLGQMSAGASIVDMTSGIYSMIGGASIAFITSVWGVTTSVLFNFFEKYLERKIRSQIGAFQNQVDYLYPRITAEQSLVNIEDINKRSSETLAELDEKIGHKMQEAMQEASVAIQKGMQESLDQILGPAIQQLVSNAHSGSEKALDSMLEKFLIGIGNAGENQKAMFEQAAQDISAASNGMSENLTHFANSIESKMANISSKNSEVIADLDQKINNRLIQQQQHDAKRQQQLTSQVSGVVEQLNRNIEAMTVRNTEAIQQSRNSFSEHISNVQQLEEDRHGVLNQQMKELVSNFNRSIESSTSSNLSVIDNVKNSLSDQLQSQNEKFNEQHSVLNEQAMKGRKQQEDLMQSITNLLNSQKDDAQQIHTGFSQLIDKFTMVGNSQQSVNEQLKNTSTELKSVSTQLGMLSLNLKSAAENLSERVVNAIDGITSVSEQTESQIITLKGISENSERINANVNDLIGGLSAASNRAEVGFTAVGQHFESLMNSLRKHVEDLESKVADLLNGYGEQVERQTMDRMKTWNDQTRDYTSSMTDAINTLNSVVDEMDSKLSTKQGSYV